jgi:TetR/AcrR family transcriptional regulator, mexCD-oprJ operon repressor
MEPRDTRAAAMAAALELAMTRPAASLDEVARHAGIGRATLFRHFANRTALLREAGQRVIAALEPRLEEAVQADGTPEQRLRALVALLVEAGLPLHAVFAAPDLVGDPALRRAVKRLDRSIEPVLQACIEAGVLRSDLSPAWIDAAFDGLLYAAWTAVREGRLKTDAAVGCLCDTLLYGFGGRGGR